MSRSTSSLPPLLALSAATFTTVSAEMMPAGVLDSLSTSLAVSEATAGLLVTVWAGTIALTAIPLVRLTLRWHRKPVLLVSLGVMAAANLATALAPSYPVAVAARVVAAAAHGLFWAVVVAYAVSLVAPDRVGRALAIVLAGPTLASLLGLPLGTALAHRAGWRVTFVALALAGVVSAAAISVLAPRPVGEATAASAGERWDRSARPVLLVAGGGFFALIGFYGLFTFIVPTSAAVAGITAGSMAGVLLASGLGGLVGVLGAGRISDRWPSSALPVTTLLLAATMAGLGLAHDPFAYVALVTILGALIGVLPVVLQAQVMRVASEQFRSTAGSILITTLNLGIALGAVLGSRAAAGDVLAWLPFLAAGVATLAIIPLGLLRPSRRTRRAISVDQTGHLGEGVSR